jgi:hypothetical protein
MALEPDPQWSRATAAPRGPPWPRPGPPRGVGSAQGALGQGPTDRECSSCVLGETSGAAPIFGQPSQGIGSGSAAPPTRSQVGMRCPLRRTGPAVGRGCAAVHLRSLRLGVRGPCLRGRPPMAGTPRSHGLEPRVPFVQGQDHEAIEAAFASLLSEILRVRRSILSLRGADRPPSIDGGVTEPDEDPAGPARTHEGHEPDAGTDPKWSRSSRGPGRVAWVIVLVSYEGGIGTHPRWVPKARRPPRSFDARGPVSSRPAIERSGPRHTRFGTRRP